MQSFFSLAIQNRLKSADMNQARNELQQVLRLAKIAEEKYPTGVTGRDHEIKNLLHMCFSIFGNRGQI
jgi:hypothetical protein